MSSFFNGKEGTLTADVKKGRSSRVRRGDKAKDSLMFGGLRDVELTVRQRVIDKRYSKSADKT